MHAEWIPVASFSTGLEADRARAVLEAAGIPVLTRSDQAGIFGLTFQGAMPRGVTLSVPSPEVNRAGELLE